MVANPGSLASIAQPRDGTALARELRSLKRRVSALETLRPILATEVDVSVSALAIPTDALTTVLTKTITIPNGFTGAVVMYAGHFLGERSGGDVANLRISIMIDGVGPTSENYELPASTSRGHVRQVTTATITGRAGGDTFDLTLAVLAGAGVFDANTGVADINALVTFLR